MAKIFILRIPNVNFLQCCCFLGLDSFNGSSHHFPVEEDKILSELEWGSQQTKKSLSSSRISSKDHEQNPDTDSTLENLSGHSLMR